MVLKYGPQKADQKYVEISEMCCCRRMEKIGWTDRVRYEVLLKGQGGEGYRAYNRKRES